LWRQDELRLEEEARRALLQHYSSKSSNQAITIVTLALVFFGFTQTLGFLQNAVVVTVYEGAVLSVLFAVGLRAIHKLLCYGFLADSIIAVGMKSEQDTLDYLNKEQLKRLCKLSQEYSETATYLERLSLACSLRWQWHINHDRRWNYRAYRYTKQLYWLIVVYFAVLSFAVSVFINIIPILPM
jgi:hypothetical protein